MRKLFFSLLFSYSITLSAQADSGLAKPVTTDAVPVLQDSSRRIEIRNYDENNIRNLKSLMKVQQARRAKEKTGALIRIGIGLLLLVVLIIGWRRRRSKK